MDVGSKPVRFKAIAIDDKHKALLPKIQQDQCKPGVEVRRDGVMKADVVISGDDDDFLVASRRKHRFEATSNVAKLVVVAPLAFVEHVAEEKYHFRSEKRDKQMCSCSSKRNLRTGSGKTGRDPKDALLTNQKGRHEKSLKLKKILLRVVLTARCRCRA